MVTAFVFSGGGSLGAVQVGMLRALVERDIRPDVLIGTSAGSLNAAFVAGHGSSAETVRDLGALWRGLRRADVFPFQPVRAVLAALGRTEAVCSPEPLARLLRRHVAFSRLERATLPLHVVTADLLSGESVILSTGDAVEALVASCAIPAVFPAVRRDGRLLCDGALAVNSGIAHAATLGADVVYLLPAGTACALQEPPRHPVAAAVHAVTLLLHQRSLLESEVYATRLDLRVLAPPCPLAISGADFGQADTLIARGYEAASSWLDTGSDRLPHPERFLSLHSHAPQPSTCA